MTDVKDKEDRAKVFWSGRSQAVRLPKEYRFDTDEVVIWKEGDKVFLKPAPTKEDDWAWLENLEPFSDDMVEAIEKDRYPPGSYERDDVSFD